MEISARNSSTKIIAIIILSLTALVFILGFAVTWLAVTNRTLIHEQRTVVTPMTYNAPFAVSETKADTEFFRMMTLSFLALRLNVSPETVDSNHAFLMSFVEPEVREEFKKVLQEEAAQIKASEQDFWKPGVRAVMFDSNAQTLMGGGRLTVTVIRENGEGTDGQR